VGLANAFDNFSFGIRGLARVGHADKGTIPEVDGSARVDPHVGTFLKLRSGISKGGNHRASSYQK
jgi:hypothetical protein